MDRYKSWIATNDTRVDQYELFDAMEKNARNLLRGLKSMRSSSSRPRYEWLDDSDRGSTKRSPDVSVTIAIHAYTFQSGRTVWLCLGTILISIFFFVSLFPASLSSHYIQLDETQMDYDYDANRNDRHSQDSKSSLPVKQYRRRAVRKAFKTVEAVRLHYKHWCVQKY